MVSKRAEELWSYLIGLEPFGETMILDRRAYDDLGLSRTRASQLATQLVKAGVVRRDVGGRYTVLKRIGAT